MIWVQVSTLLDVHIRLPCSVNADASGLTYAGRLLCGPVAAVTSYTSDGDGDGDGDSDTPE